MAADEWIWCDGCGPVAPVRYNRLGPGMNLYSRRTILGAAIAGTAAAGKPATPYATPYKYGKLVLAASPDPNAFDGRSVDCPFVFHSDGLFYMTYVGWD